jgi:hypothetical protein
MTGAHAEDSPPETGKGANQPLQGLLQAAEMAAGQRAAACGAMQHVFLLVASGCWCWYCPVAPRQHWVGMESRGASRA